ncbi:hypothetical protein [Streptomyces lunaelactis]|uniref:hypothetical protein n=1 Tax=Streptomyces lunaelactis TaxID=1535768 RepID=UPI0020C800DD|nr:hypothetical protein [Streptomyces lunaelactis]
MPVSLRACIADRSVFWATGTWRECPLLVHRPVRAAPALRKGRPQAPDTCGLPRPDRSEASRCCPRHLRQPGARAHEKAAVAVRGPLTGLLLVIYGRQPARNEGIEILGDAELLDFWLDRVGFG